ncbi:YwdI family protein [Fictibacillus sp. UD]|uniref:YwdI family protein n=1 Tax=Fictibacillus sp. UD TaxID=3038777 RepID=UPI003746F15B
MNIPVSQFAKKIEKHVAEMKQLSENSPKLREHVSAIQTLCELMLEAEEDNSAGVKEWVPSHPVQKPSSMMTAPPAKPHKKSMMDFDMDYDDDDQDTKDGNGDSIFDF